MIWVLLFVGIVVGLALATIRQPAVAIGPVVCMFAWEQWAQAKIPFLFAHSSFVNFIVAILVVLGVAVKFHNGHSLLSRFPSVVWFVLALYVYAFYSAFWSALPEKSFEIWSKEWPYLITIVILAPLLVSKLEDFRTASLSVLALGSIVAILLMLFVKWEYRSVLIQDGIRPKHGNPLEVAGLGCSVIFAVVLNNFWHKIKWWLILKWVIAFLCLALIVRTGSRGQILDAIVIVCCLWPISQRMRDVKQFFVFLVVIFAVLGITMLALEYYWGGGGSGRWSEEGMSDSLDVRLTRVFDLVSYWFSTPFTLLFGLGNSSSYSLVGSYPHLLLLEILCEEGLVGLGLFVTIVALSVRSFMRSFQRVKHNMEYRGLLAFVGAMFFSILLLSFKQGSLIGVKLLFLYAIFIGKFEMMVAGQSVEKKLKAVSIHPSLLPKRNQPKTSWRNNL